MAAERWIATNRKKKIFLEVRTKVLSVALFPCRLFRLEIQLKKILYQLLYIVHLLVFFITGVFFYLDKPSANQVHQNHVLSKS